MSKSRVVNIHKVVIRKKLSRKTACKMTLKRMSRILTGRDRLMLVVRFESNKYMNVGKQDWPRSQCLVHFTWTKDMCRGEVADNVVNVDCGLVRESLESKGFPGSSDGK